MDQNRFYDLTIITNKYKKRIILTNTIIDDDIFY